MTIPLNANELVVKAGDSIHIIDNLNSKADNKSRVLINIV